MSFFFFFFIFFYRLHLDNTSLYSSSRALFHPHLSYGVRFREFYALREIELSKYMSLRREKLILLAKTKLSRLHTPGPYRPERQKLTRRKNTPEWHCVSKKIQYRFSSFFSIVRSSSLLVSRVAFLTRTHLFASCALYS